MTLSMQQMQAALVAANDEYEITESMIETAMLCWGLLAHASLDHLAPAEANELRALIKVIASRHPDYDDSAPVGGQIDAQVN